jgi:tRNA G18 (ribose-2'-O)-methylase SpoU
LTVIPVGDPADPRLAEYRRIGDPDLLRATGMFVAEGRLVVRRVLEHGGYRVRSLLVTEAARAGLGDGLDAAPPDLSIYEVSLDAMRDVTGFDIHRGCVALVDRPAPDDVAALVGRLGNATLVVALEEVGNADNVGGVFRNALAFGAGAILLSPGCGDPLYRKAIRTSMAATLRVPFARVNRWPEGLDALRAAGFAIVALTPEAGARDIGAFAAGAGRPARVALVVGTEGAGLSAAVERIANARVRIPMAPGVDSLNLATATGIALQRLSEASYCTSICTPPTSPAATL